MIMTKFDIQMFTAEANMSTASDLAPGISVDFVSRISQNTTELQKVLGITEMESMAAGTAIKIYKLTQTNTPEQVGEGEVISLTKINRTLARTIDLTLKKYRRNTSAEAIQKVGRDVAINQSDEKLISGIQKEIKGTFFDVLLEGTGATAGVGLQATLANAWGALNVFYEDEGVSAVHFLSPLDVADYLGGAQITMQNAFGLSYVEDFLGLGTVIVSPRVPKGTTISTAKENLHGAYVPANSGDVANSFGLTADATGFIGIKHSADDTNATINTLAISGVVFFPEMLDGVIVGTINGAAEGGLDNLTVTSVAGTASGDTAITVSPALTSGNSYRYKVATNATMPAYGQSVKTWTAWDGTSDITAATGKEIVIVECDAGYKAIKAGIATVTANE